MASFETITSESEFRSALPGHAAAVFDYVKHEPALQLQPWAFSCAIVRRPSLATVLFEFVASTGQGTELWLSVAPDADGGWSVLPGGHER